MKGPSRDGVLKEVAGTIEGLRELIKVQNSVNHIMQSDLTADNLGASQKSYLY